MDVVGGYSASSTPGWVSLAEMEFFLLASMQLKTKTGNRTPSSSFGSDQLT
jgi:hypothetical protein